MKKNKRLKYLGRFLAGVLAAMMLISTLLSALSTLAAAAPGDADAPRVTTTNGGSVSRVRYNSSYNLTFSYEEDAAKLSGIPDGTTFTTSSDYTLSQNWAKNTSNSTSTTSLTLKVRESNGDWFVDVTLKNVRYMSANESTRDLDIKVSTNGIKSSGGGTYTYKPDTISTTLSDDYFSSSGSTGSSGDDSTSYSSKIMIENAVALDSKGNRIDEVTKDTPSFTLEVIYADIGLQNAYTKDIEDGTIQAYFTGGSFEMKDSNRGTAKLITGGGDYPRFRATFKNVTYTGTGKDFGFQIFYLLDDADESISGEATANLSAIKLKEDDDDTKMEMAQPKIIISNYSYGQDTIVAGAEFKLDFTITNTSTELPLENIVVTLTPSSNEAATKGPGLIVSSSSNTIYVQKLAAGASQNYSVSFQARPDAEVTSHLINVRFSYEYIDTSLEKREKVPDLSESIAIPVSQIDRFELSPIFDSVWAVEGEEGYLTVNFVNLGKSTTNNISGSIRMETDTITAPSQHYGNLEPGKADSLDIYLVGTQPGTFEGEVVITYEDENNEKKELTTPFAMTVDERWYPSDDGGGMMPDLPDEPVKTGPGFLSIFLCVIGGIAIAVPLALYLMKRTKAMGSEDFDEIS